MTGSRLLVGQQVLSADFVAANQRGRILDAVTEVTAAVGFLETTVESVIAAAGVSRRTFYEHYRNKEDAFLAAYNDAVLGLVEHMGDACEGRDGPGRRFHAGVRGALEYLAADPARARMFIVEVQAAGPRALARRHAALQALIRFMADEIRRLWPEHPTPEISAAITVGGFYEIGHAYILRGEVQNLPDLADDLVRSVLPRRL